MVDFVNRLGLGHHAMVEFCEPSGTRTYCHGRVLWCTRDACYASGNFPEERIQHCAEDVRGNRECIGVEQAFI